jgi:hypothetical protein
MTSDRRNSGKEYVTILSGVRAAVRGNQVTDVIMQVLNVCSSPKFDLGEQ